MKHIKSLVVALALVAGGVFAVSAPAMAATGTGCTGANCISTGAQQTQTGTSGVTLETQIKNVTNVLLFITGAVAVIFIVIGGMRYVTSNGDSNQVKAAKDTILYAVIGLVVAILAYALVDWVVDAFV